MLSKPLFPKQVSLGVWKKVFNKPHAKHRPYPKIKCHKCGKTIPRGTWFYVRIKGGKNPRRAYYCESCFNSLWV